MEAAQEGHLELVKYLLAAGKFAIPVGIVAEDVLLKKGVMENLIQC